MDKITEKDLDLLIGQVTLAQNELNATKLSYSYTQELKESVRSGNIDAVRNHIYMQISEDYIKEQGPLGLKLMEYTAIIIISECGTAAYEGGLSIRNVHTISDTLYHLLATDHSMDMVLSVIRLAPLYFAREVHRMNRKDSYVMEQIRNYIARHIFQKISLAEIAEHVGYSPSYTSRIFIQETGIHLQDYIMIEKIKSSCHMLIFSSYPISAIAEYYCFSSQSHYTQTFKKWMKCTPSQYRKNNVNPHFNNGLNIENSF